MRLVRVKREDGCTRMDDAGGKSCMIDFMWDAVADMDIVGSDLKSDHPMMQILSLFSGGDRDRAVCGVIETCCTNADGVPNSFMVEAFATIFDMTLVNKGGYWYANHRTED